MNNSSTAEVPAPGGLNSPTIFDTFYGDPFTSLSEGGSLFPDYHPKRPP
jgi:hypothetical protein